MSRRPLGIQGAEEFRRYNVFQVSPDGRWYALKADGPGEAYNNLWIGDVDGTQQQFVQGDFTYSHVYWVNVQTIIVGNSQGGATDWPQLETRFNPFTGQSEELEPIYLRLGVFAFGPSGDQVAYAGSFPAGWRLYNFDTGADTPILPWAKEHAVDIGDSINWTEAGISIALLSADGLELAINLASADLSATQVPRYQVRLENDLLRSGVVWWSSDNQLIAFTQTALTPTEQLPVRILRILDTKVWVQYEYCLPSQLVPGVVHATLDDRFLAWEGYLGKEPGVLVLDITTGKRTWLPDIVDLIGWAVVSGSP